MNNHYYFCLISKQCSGVQCYDTIDGAQCGPCPTNYEGDGRQCHMRNACIDEPCAPGTSTHSATHSTHHHLKTSQQTHHSYNVIVN